MQDILTGSNPKNVIRKRGASVLKDVGESLLRAVASPKKRIKSKPAKKNLIRNVIVAESSRPDLLIFSINHDATRFLRMQ